jgi:predicted RNA-binding protein YlxR (DUF448 family)
MKPRKIPLRKCIACEKQFPKKDLLRIVLHPQEGVVIDPGGKKNGRGAFVHVKVDILKHFVLTEGFFYIFHFN